MRDEENMVVMDQLQISRVTGKPEVSLLIAGRSDERRTNGNSRTYRTRHRQGVFKERRCRDS